MAQHITLGPFDAQAFLVPPNATSNPATGSVLKLERFHLLHNGSEIGLDHIHGDRLEAKALLKDGLRWRGIVLFSNATRNKTQISKLGLELLYTAAQASLQNIRVHWIVGFKVVLEGVYWRHSFLRRYLLAPSGTRGRAPISCDLHVDLEPVFVERSPRSTALNQRRFSVVSATDKFMAYSPTTCLQSGLILALEDIKRVKGRHKKVRDMTVVWYCARYKEMYPTTPPNGESEISSHQPRTNANSFYSTLASQLDSSTFRENLVVHKRLFSKDNLAKFRRDVETVGTFPPEEPEPIDMEDAEQGEDLIVIEDTPSPPLEMGDVEEGADELRQEQMDVDDASSENHAVEPNPDWEELTEWDSSREDIVELPTTPTPEPPTTRPSVIQTLGALALDAETVRLLPMIPPVLFDPPILPQDCQWVCPVAGCSALFNLKGKLPRRVLEHLTAKEIELLKSCAFTAKSPRTLGVFCVVVDVHYAQHLAKLGITADRSKPGLIAIDVEPLV